MYNPMFIQPIKVGLKNLALQNELKITKNRNNIKVFITNTICVTHPF